MSGGPEEPSARHCAQRGELQMFKSAHSQVARSDFDDEASSSNSTFLLAFRGLNKRLKLALASAPDRRASGHF